MNKTHLEFILSEYSLTAVKASGDTFEPIGFLKFSAKKEFQIKEQIQQFLSDHQLTETEFDEYSLSWFSPSSTLVPMNVFGASSAVDIFHACYTKPVVTNDIDYNRIAELSLVNVYDIPLWVKSFFVIRYPRIVLQHEGSVFLRGIFATSSFPLSVHIVLHQQHFILTIVKHNRLLFYNIYECGNENDLLYYLTFSLQQQNLTREEGNLFIYPSEEAGDELFNNTLSGIAKINDLKHLTIRDTENSPYKYQQLCV